MEWEQIPPREVGAMADKAIAYLEAAGAVKDAYYRIHDNHYPVIYGSLSGGALDGLRIVIRADSVANVIERMERDDREERRA